MNKKRMTTIATALLVATTALFASGASESRELWSQANKVVDHSANYLPGTRTIAMRTLGVSGDILETSQATVHQALSGNDSHVDVRAVGDKEILDVLGKFFDGRVVTPFDNALFSVDSKATATEIVDG